jgi:hypothetical protein
MIESLKEKGNETDKEIDRQSFREVSEAVKVGLGKPDALSRFHYLTSLRSFNIFSTFKRQPAFLVSLLSFL